MKDPNTWSMQQAYFAGCGGLAVDTSAFWHEDRLTFTSTGIVTLAK